MEKVMTSKFTAKDLFNASSATPIKDVENKVLEIEAVAIKEKVDGQLCGYLKGTDGTIYATISATVIEQLTILADIIEQDGALQVKVKANVSKGNNRTYYMLELLSNI